MLAKLVELPLGELAARLLEDIRRARELFKEIESFYKRCLNKRRARSRAGPWKRAMSVAKSPTRVGRTMQRGLAAPLCLNQQQALNVCGPV